MNIDEACLQSKLVHLYKFIVSGLHSKFARQAAGNASEVVLDADGEGDKAVHALLPRMESFKNCPEMRKLLKFLCQIYNFTESNKVTLCIVSFSFLTVCGAIIIFSFFLYLT